MTPRFAFALAVLLMVTVVVGASMAIADERPRLNLYVNSEVGYSFIYPDGWTLLAEPTGCERDFCHQTTTAKTDEAEVYIVVGFMGGWCESTRDIARRDLEVSGIPGEEFICPGFGIRSFAPADSIIWYFPDANGQKNYVVLGQSHPGELDEVEDVVRSFRIIPAGH